MELLPSSSNKSKSTPENVIVHLNIVDAESALAALPSYLRQTTTTTSTTSTTTTETTMESDCKSKDHADSSALFGTSPAAAIRSKVMSFFDRVRNGEHDNEHDDAAVSQLNALKLQSAEEALRGIFANDIASTDLNTKLSKELLEATSILCHGYLCTEYDRNEKVINFKHPAVLRQEIGHLLHMNDPDPVDVAQLLRDCDIVLRNCVRTGHPRFFNQISNGIDLMSLVGEWITSTVNTNMFTYEISPVFVLMEDAILRTMMEYVGYKPEASDGILAPGGTISNLYAVLAARLRACPELRLKGLNAGRPLVLFTSSHSHYSVHRSGVIAGLGLQNVVEIGVDSRGKMNIDELEAAINRAKEEGKMPFLVVATAGTTVLGAFDPIRKIAAIAKAHNMWLHVDAAWGGGAVISPKHKHLLDGVELSNSVTWNPHKMMGVTLQCSVFLTTDKTVLCEMNSMSAEYLFQQDKNYDVSYDTGDKSLQCGRHNDIFKFWLTWRSKGRQGFVDKIDHLFELADYALQEVKRRKSNFTLYLEEIECLNICFWYVPNCLLKATTSAHPHPYPEDPAILDRVAPLIKARMMESGHTMVGYQPIDEKPNFFRLIISSSAVTKDDIKFLIDEIEEIGSKITIQDLQA